MVTKKLGTTYLNPETQRRFDLILDLHRRGWKSREISDFLNEIGVKPQRTDRFTAENIWVTVKKLKNREVKEQVVALSEPEWLVKVMSGKRKSP